MNIEGSAKFVYEYRLVLVMRIEVSSIFGEFMGIECASSRTHTSVCFNSDADLGFHWESFIKKLKKYLAPFRKKLSESLQYSFALAMDLNVYLYFAFFWKNFFRKLI